MSIAPAREDGNRRRAGDGGSAVAVVIPTRDRRGRLEMCLAALLRCAPLAPRFEVVVVDDGGSEPLDELAVGFSGRLAVRLVRQRGLGPAAARNAGARLARAPLLAFLDDDCEPAPEWVAALDACHRRWPGALIGGSVRNGLPGNAFAEATQTLLDYLYAQANREASDAAFFASLNLAAPRQAFLELGGFDAAYPLAAAEDRDLCLRWKASGRRLVYAADALVTHSGAASLRAFLSQHFRYGRGARRFHRRARVPSRSPAGWGFYAGIVAAPFRLGRAAPARGAALLLLAQAATLAGYGHELWSGRDGEDRAQAAATLTAGAPPP